MIAEYAEQAVARITAATGRAALADRESSDVLASAAPAVPWVGGRATWWIVAG